MPLAHECEVSRLVRENQGLVKKLANRYSKGATERYEDIEAAGLLGLVKAAQRFDPAKGFKFSSIAVPWIRGEILHYLRGKGGNPRVPRRWQDLYMKGYKLPDAEAAAKCEISIEQWLEIKQACSTWVGEWQPSYEKSWEPETDEEGSEELTIARSQIQQWLESLEAGDRLLVEQIFFAGKTGDKRQRDRVQDVLEAGFPLEQKTPHWGA